jgi:hypothetical protein
MFQLVKFSCGCVGTKPVGGTSTIINSCDGEGNLSFYQRKIDLKTFEPLDPKETEEFRGQIERLILDGYNMKTMRSVLGVQTQLKKLLE